MINGKPLILVVDDELDARLFLFSLLESDGFLVATSSSADEALKYVARNHPDLVLSDVRMPDVEGLELLSEIKRLSPRTRVVLLSAYADWPMYSEAVEKGGDDLLLKPSKNEEILRTVHRVLEEARV
ncbi:MAG: response regulator [Planctomycetes bacterium]|nr:response regulator [Planctomycetota bacterium]